MVPKMLGFATAFVVITATALITQRAEAETHTVGDATGWTNIVDSDTYSSWAAKHTFKVGDTLVFQFTTGRHDVATLTKKAYDECSNTDILGVLNQGPASYSLNETGDYYFICAFPGHCSEGQKLSIKVTASRAAAPLPSDSKVPASPPTTMAPPPSDTKTPLSPPTTTAPSPSAASSLASTFSTVFMSIAIALFCLF
ncbi:mavicyanin-like [Pyrus x bretschneideri]|uniref:mavicyanin-like n=1 Tax=Pyrus x bretschneideri TaxID=225117 RepID=UPI0005109D12|nr:mavicyanin-like [Pyrus x bretschneideri]